MANNNYPKWLIKTLLLVAPPVGISMILKEPYSRKERLKIISIYSGLGIILATLGLTVTSFISNHVEARINAEKLAQREQIKEQKEQEERQILAETDKKLWEDAVRVAGSAANKAQTALTIADWEYVSSQWVIAIEYLHKISRDSENYDISREKISEYREYQKYADIQIVRLDGDEKWAEAVKFAEKAAELAGESKTVNEWQNTANAWKSAHELMQSIPAESPRYTVAQQKAIEYKSNQQQALSRRESARNSGGTTPFRAPIRGSCDCPYDIDSRGNRCGGRSAYSRPGGSNPICYK